MRYAEALVRMLTGRGQGPQRVRHALHAAGLSPEAVAAALTPHPTGRRWRQTFVAANSGPAPQDWPGRARQMRFLQYRGFSKDHIASALASSGADDPDSAETSIDDDS